MRTLGSRRPSVLFQQTTKPVSRRTPVWDDPDEDCPSGVDAIVLKGWQNGTYPAGWGNKPVTWVSLDDARAYASWSGKRLPHEWEWQYATVLAAPSLTAGGAVRAISATSVVTAVLAKACTRFMAP